SVVAVLCSAYAVGCQRAAAPSAKTPAPTAVVTASTTAPAAVPAASDLESLRARLDLAVAHVQQRQLLTTHAFWTIFHGILGLGPDMQLLDSRTGKKLNALAYIFNGDFDHGPIRGLRFVPTRHGLDVQTGPVHEGQGHQDQFIAEIAQWGVPIDTPVSVYGKQYSMLDFVHESQAHARLNADQELSWCIVVVGQYLGTKVEWTNGFGEKIKYDDVVRYELAADIESAACGGTHRLFGLSWAYHLHRRAGGVDEGVWKEVRAKLDRYRDVARETQNADGSFSTMHFRGRRAAGDAQERLGSSGHILEWLATDLSDAELREPWMQNAANAVSLMILDLQSNPMESGALYHAVHGLVTYRYRVFEQGGPALPNGAGTPPVARVADKTD
ncbi:MAG: hypothetical protein ACRDD1_16860, partial [Planctomycetia bacterium]